MQLRNAFLLPEGEAVLDLALDSGLTFGSDEELTIVGSLVDTTLHNVAETSRVRILINGEPAETLGGHVDLTRPLLFLKHRRVRTWPRDHAARRADGHEPSDAPARRPQPGRAAPGHDRDGRRAPRRGLRADRARRHARALRGLGRGPRAAVSQGQRAAAGSRPSTACCPRATHTRSAREAAQGQQGGRTLEIQRLIGRSLRSVTELRGLGERTITLDCDVLQADGGTRCAGDHRRLRRPRHGARALVREGRIPRWPLRETVAAISVGICAGQPVLDLAYAEDAEADVDCNVVGTASGNFVEIQGTAERRPFSEEQLAELLALARKGLTNLRDLQAEALAPHVAGIDFT